jgi:hypothetical protein
VTPDEAREAVYAAFLTQWADQTPVALEGRKFDEPEPGVSWVRLAFRNYGGGQHTLGPSAGRIFRRTGAALVQVFTPASKGMGPGATLAQAARAIFEGRTVGAVQFNDGQVREIPLQGEEKSLQTNVEVRGTYDETK